MPTKPVDVQDLKLGMYVAKLDRPWTDSPFLFQGFRIENEDELGQLRQHCRYVYIDPELGYDGPRFERNKPKPSGKTEPRVATGSKTGEELLPREPELRQAIPQVYQYRRQAIGFLDNVLKQVRADQSVNTGAAGHVVEGLLRSVQLNLNASMWLNNLKRRHEHSATHCTNVAVVALAFAHHLGYTGQKLIDVGIGALLHDIGLMRLPTELLDKPEKLSAEEEREMREHPESGSRLIARRDEVSSTVLNIIRYHHERVDGSGYPDGLSGKQVPEEAMIVALADIYDAMTTERPYKTPASPHGSMNIIRQLADSHFPPSLVQAFMSCIGIYPIGTVVQLNNGVVALVVGHTRRTRLRPEIMLLKHRDGQVFRTQPLLDLDKIGSDRNPEQWQILRVVNPKDFGVDVARATEIYVDRLYAKAVEQPS